MDASRIDFALPAAIFEVVAMPYRPTDIDAALKQFRKRDPVLRGIVERVGPFTLKTKRDHFSLLVRSIVSQQISTSAARTILKRLTDHVAPQSITASALASIHADQLRALGLSAQKASYVHDLSHRVNDGRLKLNGISRRSDEEVVKQLVEVRGIGVWTAHMFMIFGLGRLDVLPVGDLGIKNAVQKFYGFQGLPTATELTETALPWRPYASVASWYLWRSLDLQD